MNSKNTAFLIFSMITILSQGLGVNAWSNEDELEQDGTDCRVETESEYCVMSKQNHSFTWYKKNCYSSSSIARISTPKDTEQTSYTVQSVEKYCVVRYEGWSKSRGTCYDRYGDANRDCRYSR